LSACTRTTPPPTEPADTPDYKAQVVALRAENKTLRAELDDKKEAILQLTGEVEKKAAAATYMEEQLERTREVLEYAERQFISLERGLQSYETKASAVAALAEAKLSFDKTLRNQPFARNMVNVQQAREKIKESDILLSQKRYAASVYFSKRAIRLLEETRSQESVRIVSADDVNMHTGPGREYEVIARLDVGTVLIQVDYDAPWLRVETRGGQAGWVHESLTVSQ
jgi:uncharacterized protein (DUF3084 family)